MKNKKNILVINGHPRKGSYSDALAKAYSAGAKEGGHKVTVVTVRALSFDPILSERNKGIENDLLVVQKKITDADHLVFIYPVWWGTMPALLKGFLDRVLTSGFAYEWKGKRPEGLLKRKSARVITTMGAPSFVYSLPPFLCFDKRLFKYAILWFCGIKKVRYTRIGKVPVLSKAKLEKKLELIKNLGVKGK
jgi:NAD(P)H dehydrogenase (quinone)